MRFVMPIVKEGDGTTFNHGVNYLSPWAGRWGEYYLRQRYPRSWRIRKVMKNVRGYFKQH